MFQFDAAVNEGNSGGPVYNTKGEVVGIVTAKYASTGVEGLGFAIPINNVSDIVDQLIKQGYVSGQSSLGITVKTVDSAVAQYYNMGILNHTVGAPDDTMEATAVRLSDRIAYINHDVDDAMRAGIITEAELPPIVIERIGKKHSARINSIILDILMSSQDGPLQMSPDMAEAVDTFHEFLYEHVYRNPRAKGEEAKVAGILGALWDWYDRDPARLPADYRRIADDEGVERAVCDYVSGMTDDYAVYKFNSIYIPKAWQVK